MAAHEYDDGRAVVPGSIDGSVERVVVVGAGIAGLTAANALQQAGVECFVLEARDRIGGRLHTLDLTGWPVDLGGSWIHTPVGNPLRRYADQTGVECMLSNPLGSLSIYDAVESRVLSAAEADAAATMQLEEFADAVEQRLRSELGPDASSADAVEQFVSTAGYDAADARRARQMLRAMIEADASGPAEEQALRWLWTEDEYDGDFFGDTPVGGYRNVVEAIAAGLDVRLDAPVTEVRLGDGEVVVRSVAGEEHRASHAVIAAPLGCLKRGRPTFDPPLPPDRQERIDRVGFGRYEKVILAYPTAWWREHDRSHLVLVPEDPARTAQWVFDLDAFAGQPVLSAHFFHTDAVALAAAPDRAVQELRAALAAAIGEPGPEPVAVHVTSWGSDPWTCGAYTHIPPGSSPADLDELGEPVGGRLLFAGEHTQSRRIGYADGAMASGIREAKRLLGRSSVQLT